MAAPKPSAPSKPLTFRPPELLGGQTKSSELPVETKKKKQNRRGQDADVSMVDEAVHVESLDGGMVMAMPIEAVEDIAQHSSEEERQKAIFDFSTKADKKSASEKTKKPFVLDPHLTQRPFHDDRLMQLKSELQRPSSQNR